jgi:hypothetical protein
LLRSLQPNPQAQQMQQMVQQLELMKLQMEIEEMKAGAMKDMAHAAKLQSDAQDKNSESATWLKYRLILQKKWHVLKNLK